MSGHGVGVACAIYLGTYVATVPASGCGEPPIVCMGAVVANALYGAVGARLFQLPMTPARVKEALRRT